MPENTPYLLLGLAAVTVIMGVFLVSLVIRWRSLHQDIETIEQLEGD